jgi:hypothetical protein
MNQKDKFEIFKMIKKISNKNVLKGRLMEISKLGNKLMVMSQKENK